MSLQIVEKTAADVVWSFTRPPKFSFGNWAGAEDIDPTPAYAHDMNLVKFEVGQLDNLIDVPATFYVTHFEGTGRTNGWASTSTDYDGDRVNGKYVDKLYYVVLNGKRIPPHPAMTRYLVAHEYGHCIQYWLENRWGLNEGDLITAYNKAFRKVEAPAYYGPGTWHLTPGEHFANDFRICGAFKELEFWPHPGVMYPSMHISQWWQKTLDDPHKDRLEELYERGT